jgi:AcrR family transcriptional regulator
VTSLIAIDGSRAPLSDRGRRTRERLVVSARRVFEERGFDATRMGDIAQAAGVSHGTVYTWFATKEDLLHATVDSVTDEMYAALSTPDATDPIERIAIANRRYLEAHRSTARLMDVVGQAAVTDASFRAVLTRLRHTHVDRVAKTITRLQDEGLATRELDPHISAAALCAMVEGFAKYWLVTPQGDDSADEPDADDAIVIRTLTDLWARALGLVQDGGH